MKHTKRGLSILALSIALSGCTVLPGSLQMVAWALDGVSMLVSQKSLTDHGISIVAQKDCAVWRGVTEGQLCREFADKPGTGETVALSLSTPLATHAPEAEVFPIETETHLLEREQMVAEHPTLGGLYLKVM